MPLATLLLAFLLRVYRLGDANVWWDEGWSVWLAQKDLTWIALRTAADEHPPLHYWMIHFWNMLAGTEAFTGRFLSVAFGVLTVALIYRIGKKLGGAWMGVLAALFLSVARFHIWWSQDIKNYTPSIFFAFAAVWFALCLLDKPNRKTILAYAVCAALALWTHYLAALVLFALNLYVAGLLLFARLHALTTILRPWLFAQLLGALLFAPWMVLYLQNAAAWSAAPAFDFALFLKLVATVLPLGVTTNIDHYAVLTILLTSLALLGCLSSLQSSWSSVLRRRSGATSLLNTEHLTVANCATAILNTGHSPLTTRHYSLFTVIVLLPPLLLYVFSLTPVSFFAPKIQARYLLVLLPAYVMLLVLGVRALRRVSIYLAIAAVVVILGASGFVLDDYYAGRRLRDDYTTLANTINSFALPGDLVLLDTDQEWPTLLYYLRGSPEWLGVPNGAVMNAANAENLVRRARAQHTAVWLVAIPDALATDPQRLVETRLARDLPKQFEQTFGDKRLALYAAAPRDLVDVPRENFAPEQVRLFQTGEELQLLGFDMPAREVRAGDTLRVVTYWRAARESSANVILQLQTGTLTRTAHVKSGDRVRVENDFLIPPDARGTATLNINSSELARVTVELRAPLAGAGSIAHPVDLVLGDRIHLVGYDLLPPRLRAGGNMSLTLYWRAALPVEKNYTVFVHLLGTTFNEAQNNYLWGQVDRVPREGASPTTTWLPRQVIPDVYSVPVNPQAPPGRYKIEVGMYDPATGERLNTGGGQDSLILDEIELTK